MHQPCRTLIVGTAGRDFHVFNTLYRTDPDHVVLGFTAADTPETDGRYPSFLSGALYPDGIPILPEAELEQLVARLGIEEIVFAYSELGCNQVVRLAARALAAGADFRLVSPMRSMLPSTKPVIAVTAASSGAGKTPTVRYLAELLVSWGLQVAVVRQPVRPQGFTQPVRERDASLPGVWTYSGLDYAEILATAEAEADVILWDGVGNDLPFLQPKLHIALTDPLRAGEEADFFPGEVGLRLADVVIITKCESAGIEQIERCESGIAAINPDASVLTADSPVLVEGGEGVAGRTVVIVEEAHTLSLGAMKPGAGLAAARLLGVSAIISPLPQAVGALVELYRLHPEAQSVLPVPGFGPSDLADVRATLEATSSEGIIDATRIDLAALLGLDRPVARAAFALSPHDPDQLARLVRASVCLPG